MDEDIPHMHLLFIPVVHTTDKQGNKNLEWIGWFERNFIS